MGMVGANSRHSVDDAECPGQKQWASKEAIYEMDLHKENERCQCDHPEHNIPSALVSWRTLTKVSSFTGNRFHIPEVSSQFLIYGKRAALITVVQDTGRRVDCTSDELAGFCTSGKVRRHLQNKVPTKGLDAKAQGPQVMRCPSLPGWLPSPGPPSLSNPKE